MSSSFLTSNNGNPNKGDKNKGKFQTLNINTLFKGKGLDAQRSGKSYGFQSLGKVASSKKMPPPAILPSLRAENQGNDPSINLVSSGTSWATKENNDNPSTNNENELKNIEVNTSLAVSNAITKTWNTVNTFPLDLHIKPVILNIIPYGTGKYSSTFQKEFPSLSSESKGSGSPSLSTALTVSKDISVTALSSTSTNDGFKETVSKANTSPNLSEPSITMTNYLRPQTNWNISSKKNGIDGQNKEGDGHFWPPLESSDLIVHSMNSPISKMNTEMLTNENIKLHSNHVSKVYGLIDGGGFSKLNYLKQDPSYYNYGYYLPPPLPHQNYPYHHPYYSTYPVQAQNAQILKEMYNKSYADNLIYKERSDYYKDYTKNPYEGGHNSRPSPYPYDSFKDDTRIKKTYSYEDEYNYPIHNRNRHLPMDHETDVPHKAAYSKYAEDDSYVNYDSYVGRSNVHCNENWNSHSSTLEYNHHMYNNFTDQKSSKPYFSPVPLLSLSLENGRLRGDVDSETRPSPSVNDNEKSRMMKWEMGGGNDLPYYNHSKSSLRPASHDHILNKYENHIYQKEKGEPWEKFHGNCRAAKYNKQTANQESLVAPPPQYITAGLPVDREVQDEDMWKVLRAKQDQEISQALERARLRKGDNNNLPNNQDIASNQGNHQPGSYKDHAFHRKNSSFRGGEVPSINHHLQPPVDISYNAMRSRNSSERSLDSDIKLSNQRYFYSPPQPNASASVRIRQRNSTGDGWDQKSTSSSAMSHNQHVQQDPFKEDDVFVKYGSGIQENPLLHGVTSSKQPFSHRSEGNNEGRQYNPKKVHYPISGQRNKYTVRPEDPRGDLSRKKIFEESTLNHLNKVIRPNSVPHQDIRQNEDFHKERRHYPDKNGTIESELSHRNTQDKHANLSVNATNTKFKWVFEGGKIIKLPLLDEKGENDIEKDKGMNSLVKRNESRSQKDLLEKTQLPQHEAKENHPPSYKIVHDSAKQSLPAKINSRPSTTLKYGNSWAGKHLIPDERSPINTASHGKNEKRAPTASTFNQVPVPTTSRTTANTNDPSFVGKRVGDNSNQYRQDNNRLQGSLATGTKGAPKYDHVKAQSMQRNFTDEHTRSNHNNYSEVRDNIRSNRQQATKVKEQDGVGRFDKMEKRPAPQASSPFQRFPGTKVREKNVQQLGNTNHLSAHRTSQLHSPRVSEAVKVSHKVNVVNGAPMSSTAPNFNKGVNVGGANLDGKPLVPFNRDSPQSVPSPPRISVKSPSGWEEYEEWETASESSERCSALNAPDCYNGSKHQQANTGWLEPDQINKDHRGTGKDCDKVKLPNSKYSPPSSTKMSGEGLSTLAQNSYRSKGNHANKFGESSSNNNRSKSDFLSYGGETRTVNAGFGRGTKMSMSSRNATNVNGTISRYDVNDIASVVVIDDHPNYRQPSRDGNRFSNSTHTARGNDDDFQEVLNRKALRSRNKGNALSPYSVAPRDNKPDASQPGESSENINEVQNVIVDTMSEIGTWDEQHFSKFDREEDRSIVINKKSQSPDERFETDSYTVKNKLQSPKIVKNEKEGERAVSKDVSGFDCPAAFASSGMTSVVSSSQMKVRIPMSPPVTHHHSSNTPISPSAADLNLRIASVKKVWDTTENKITSAGFTDSTSRHQRPNKNIHHQGDVADAWRSSSSEDFAITNMSNKSPGFKNYSSPTSGSLPSGAGGQLHQTAKHFSSTTIVKPQSKTSCTAFESGAENISTSSTVASGQYVSSNVCKVKPHKQQTRSTSSTTMHQDVVSNTFNPQNQQHLQQMANNMVTSSQSLLFDSPDQAAQIYPTTFIRSNNMVGIYENFLGAGRVTNFGTQATLDLSQQPNASENLDGQMNNVMPMQNNALFISNYGNSSQLTNASGNSIDAAMTNNGLLGFGPNMSQNCVAYPNLFPSAPTLNGGGSNTTFHIANQPIPLGTFQQGGSGPLVSTSLPSHNQQNYRTPFSQQISHQNIDITCSKPYMLGQPVNQNLCVSQQSQTHHSSRNLLGNATTPMLLQLDPLNNFIDIASLAQQYQGGSAGSGSLPPRPPYQNQDGRQNVSQTVQSANLYNYFPPPPTSTSTIVNNAFQLGNTQQQGQGVGRLNINMADYAASYLNQQQQQNLAAALIGNSAHQQAMLNNTGNVAAVAAAALQSIYSNDRMHMLAAANTDLSNTIAITTANGALIKNSFMNFTNPPLGHAPAISLNPGNNSINASPTPQESLLFNMIANNINHVNNSQLPLNITGGNATMYMGLQRQLNPHTVSNAGIIDNLHGNERSTQSNASSLAALSMSDYFLSATSKAMIHPSQYPNNANNLRGVAMANISSAYSQINNKYNSLEKDGAQVLQSNSLPNFLRKTSEQSWNAKRADYDVGEKGKDSFNATSPDSINPSKKSSNNAKSKNLAPTSMTTILKDTKGPLTDIKEKCLHESLSNNKVVMIENKLASNQGHARDDIGVNGKYNSHLRPVERHRYSQLQAALVDSLLSAASIKDVTERQALPTSPGSSPVGPLADSNHTERIPTKELPYKMENKEAPQPPYLQESDLNANNLIKGDIGAQISVGTKEESLDAVILPN